MNSSLQVQKAFSNAFEMPIHECRTGVINFTNCAFEQNESGGTLLSPPFAIDVFGKQG